MEDREDKNIRDVAAQVMTKLDQEGLILRNVVNRDDTGARKIILLSSQAKLSPSGLPRSLMPDSRTILRDPKTLNLVCVRADADAIIIAARTVSCEARCPVCARRSARVHAQYTRMLSDLPWQGIPVILRLLERSVT